MICAISLIVVLLFSGCRNIWFSKCVSVKGIPIVEAKVDLLVVDDLANLGGGTLLLSRGLDQIHAGK